jgi:hypothetical protein
MGIDGIEHLTEKTRATKTPCREMFTRNCPISGCTDLPCARFHTNDESRWDLDKAEWIKENREKLT